MAGSEQAVKIRQFQGLNIREDSGVISDPELSELVNFDVGRAGELISRPGMVKISADGVLGANSVIILGHFVTDVLSQIIVRAGDNVYYTTDGINFTLIGAYADACFGLQYAGDFYIIRSGANMVKWTGAAASNIASSPQGTFAIVHKDRMFVLNSLGAGAVNSRFYYSEPGDVSATGWPGANFIDVQPGDGDLLVCMVIVQDLLVIFKGSSTWALYIQGSTVDWVLRSMNREIGCISKYATQIIEGYVYFSSATGVYRTEGSLFERISDQLGEVLDSRIVNTTTINIDSFAYWEDKLICLLAPDASTKVYYVYHMKVGGWSQYEWASDILPQTFIEVFTNAPQRGLYAGDAGSDGHLLRFGDDIHTDLGEVYPKSVKTKRFDFGDASLMKRGKWLSIDSVGIASFDWANEVDGEDVNDGTIAMLAGRAGNKIPGPGFFRTWRLSLSVTAANKVTLIGFTLHLAPSRSLIKTRT